MSQEDTQDLWSKRRYRANRVFSPGAPVNEANLFAGRTEQVEEVIDAVSRRGHHGLIYGERGVGKTSLANVIAEILNQVSEDSADLSSCSVNCDHNETYSRLWTKTLREMQVVLSKNQIGFDRPSKKELMSLEALLPEGDTSPEDVRRILQYHAGSSIIVIDEIDRIREKDTTQLLADTVKTLSDHSVDCTLVMVGVATSVDDLISEHQSIERALNQIQLPRMSRDELEEIIQNALEELEMTIDNDAQDRITSFSQGLPHYTHLLGQEACLSAIEQKSSSVEMRDVDVATEQAIEKTQRTIKKTFHDAVSSSHEDTLFIPVLVACALATGDELGRFAASDVREPLSNITGTDYKIPTFTRHLHSFSEDRGPVLVRQGSKHRHRFRFRNPLMLPYAIMYGYTENIIDEKIIEQYYNK